MTNSLSIWGVKRIFSFQSSVAAMRWDDVKPEKKAKIEKLTEKQAKKIYHTIHNMERIPYPLLRGILFKIMAAMQKSNNWNPVDRKHWEEKGWLNGAKPY